MGTSIGTHAEELQLVIKRLILAHEKTIKQIAEIVISSLRANGKVLIMGNGGSYADSLHFAAELEGAYKNRNRAALAAMVPSNPASLTAIGNDFGYLNTFKKTVQAFINKGDVVIGLSTSGNSENVIQAFQEAKLKGARVVAFTGESGGKMKEYADILLNVPSQDTPRIQEAHHFAYHEICEIVETSLFPSEK